MKRIALSGATGCAIFLVMMLSGSVHAAGVNNNPWNYSFTSTGGKLITAPNPAFCQYFHCIPSFPKGTGYIVECRDGLYSKSGGIHGSCSKNGGDFRPLYMPVGGATPVKPVTGSTMPSPILPLSGSDPFPHL